MRITATILYLTLLMLSCRPHHKPGAEKSNPKKKQQIAILPFGKLDAQFLSTLKSNFSRKLSADFMLLEETALPSSAFYKPRLRYIADSLLDFLERKNQKRYDKIIGVTSQDISTKKGDIANWGVLGLGNCPGESCVVSSFRAGRNKVPYKQFMQRMTSLGLHELGHTYGLEHCPEATCVMVDAEGKMKLDNGDSFCNGCRDRLSGKGILQ